jgi:N-acyl-D-amino-acid deacylase
VSWTRLSEYLRHVERRGAAQNVASFIGAGTLRAGAVGYGDRPKAGLLFPGLSMLVLVAWPAITLAAGAVIVRRDI